MMNIAQPSDKELGTGYMSKNPTYILSVHVPVRFLVLSSSEVSLVTKQNIIFLKKREG